MVLLELAAQAVRGFSPAVRVAFKPGYWLLTPPAPAGAPLPQLVMALLYPEGRGEDASLAADRGAKAALTFQGRDQGIYRVLRELGRSGSLERLDPQTRAFQPVTSETMELRQYLRAQAGVLPWNTWSGLFCLTPAQFPSRRPRKGEPGKAAAAPKLAQSQAIQPAADLGAAQARVKELERELGLSAEIDKLQFRIDGISQELDGLDAVTRKADGARAELAEAEAAWAEAASPEALGLPSDIVSRCERYPSLVQRQEEALAKLEAEREAEQAQAQGYVQPLTQDARFWAGVGVGTLSLVGGAMLSGVARYVALLDVPAYGFSALVALRYVETLQVTRKAGRRTDRLAAREAKIRAEFEAELASVKQAQEALRVSSPSEVVEALARKPLLAKRRQELRARLQALEADPELQSAAARVKALKEEQAAHNEQLREKAGGYVRDAREVERELARVKESIALASAPAAARAQAAAAEAPAGGFEDFGPTLLPLAADLLGTDALSLPGVVKDRVAQYLAALTDKRLVGFAFERESRVKVLAEGQAVPVGDLPARDVDLAYLALRLTVVEKYLAKARAPLLVEDGLPLDDAKLPLLARMLKHLGGATQVLHLTARPGLVPPAEGALKL